MTIKKKILSVFFFSICFIGLSFVAEHIARDKDKAQLHASDSRYLSKLIAEEFVNSSRNLTRLARTYVATGDSNYAAQYLDIVKWRNGEIPRPRHFNKDLYPGVQKPQIDIMKELNFTDAELDLLKKAAGFSNDLIETEQQAMGSIETGQLAAGPFTPQSGEAIDRFAIRILFDANYHNEVSKIMGPVSEFIAAIEQRTDAQQQTAQASAQLWTNITFFLQIAVGLCLLALVAIVYWHGLIPLNNVVAAMKEISNGDGDLGRRLTVKGKDELAELSGAFNLFVSNIMDVVKQVGSSVDSLSSSSAELADTAEKTDQSIAQQKSAIDNVSSASNQMMASVDDVARHASTAAQTARQSDAEVKGTMDVLLNSIGSIKQLTNEIDSASQAIGQLEADSNTITSVLDVIRGIADQTNLLALNAAIEAARAGEQGRGFAVVADEVRNLAQRTQDSTQEIQGMIEQLQTSAIKAVEVMQKSQEQASECVEHAENAGDSLRVITQDISTMNDMNNQIASASEEQNLAMQAINSSITTLLGQVERTVDGSKDTAQNSESMQKLSTNLKELIGTFKVA